MSREKPSAKLSHGWELWVVPSIIVLVGSVLFLYFDYREKGYLEAQDLIRVILPAVILLLALAAVMYWANRPEKEK